jgi:hypothetical protein
MHRVKQLLRYIVAFQNFNKTFCAVCLISGSLTGIILSIAAFRVGSGHSRIPGYLMLAIAALNAVTTALFLRTIMRRKRAATEGTARQKSNVLAELFAGDQMAKSTFALILSFGLVFILMFCNHLLVGENRISSAWLIAPLLPAGLSCLNSFLINMRVAKGTFGFNSLEGMEIIQLIKKRGVRPPSDGGPGIFRDFQRAQELEGMRELKDARIA